MGPPSVHYVHHGSTKIDIGPHVFPVEKYALVAGWISEELDVPPERQHAPESLGEEDLLAVHTREYVADLLGARPTWRTLQSELPVEGELIRGFVSMAGGTVTAARLALRHGVGFHVGGGFHHAFADHAEGFCYVNDVALAFERLRREGQLGASPRAHGAAAESRNGALVVDLDVHQGNGTAALYAGRRDTFTYSLHQEDNYPLKETSDLDRGLPDGVGDEEYLALLASDLDAVDARIVPELVVYLAGVDPYEHDQLGGLALTSAGLASRDRLVLERYVSRGLPLVVLLAGGYARSPEETARLHLQTARAAEDACRPPSA